MQQYCPQLSSRTRLSKWDCRDHLIAAIEQQWKLGFDYLPSEETLYHALRGTRCSSGMKEKLALLYYARLHAEKCEELMRTYISIFKRQRQLPTPYWNRFVEEYKRLPNPKKKPVYFPRNVAKWLEQLNKLQKQKLRTGLKKEAGRK